MKTIFDTFVDDACHLQDNYPAEYKAWVDEEERKLDETLFAKTEDLFDRMDQLEWSFN